MSVRAIRIASTRRVMSAGARALKRPPILTPRSPPNPLITIHQSIQHQTNPPNALVSRASSPLSPSSSGESARGGGGGKNKGLKETSSSSQNPGDLLAPSSCVPCRLIGQLRLYSSIYGSLRPWIVVCAAVACGCVCPGPTFASQAASRQQPRARTTPGPLSLAASKASEHSSQPWRPISATCRWPPRLAA